MLCRVDRFRFFNRPVVQPQYNVAIVPIIIEVGTGDWNRLIGLMVEDSQRACCIKANAANTLRIYFPFA